MQKPIVWHLLLKIVFLRGVAIEGSRFSKKIGEKLNSYLIMWRLTTLPVMAAVAVRKKVVSISHFSFVSGHCKSFYLLDQIKSNCMYCNCMDWLHWKSAKNRTEPNEQDELKCSKSLNQTTSYAHWHAFLYLHAHIKIFIPLKIRKKKIK